nr:hypothetical protein [uncultured Carboxylicivirga sp.]
MLEITKELNRVFELHDNVRRYTALNPNIPKKVNSIFSVEFEDLYYESMETEYLWSHCPFATYKMHYQVLLDEYIYMNPDGLESEFILNEIQNIKGEYVEVDKEILLSHGIINHNGPIHSHIYTTGKERLKLVLRFVLEKNTYNRVCQSQDRKLSFLNSRLEQLNTKSNQQILSPVEPILDLSDNKPALQFVMLHELGFIDHLDMHSDAPLSESKKASILSYITGIKADNLRKMINGSKNDDRNKKLTVDNITKVHHILSNLGINTKKLKNSQSSN